MTKLSKASPFLTIALLAILALILALIYYPTLSTYTYDGAYHIEVNGRVTKLLIRNQNVLGKYQLFTCEENYRGAWETDQTVNRDIWKSPSGLLQEYKSQSTLYTMDIIRNYNFMPSSFTCILSRIYTQNSINQNNQIIIDILNDYANYTENSIVFHGSYGAITVNVTYANTPFTIQQAGAGFSEAQIDFNGQSDRDYCYHEAGLNETIAFTVTFT